MDDFYYIFNGNYSLVILWQQPEETTKRCREGEEGEREGDEEVDSRGELVGDQECGGNEGELGENGSECESITRESEGDGGHAEGVNEVEARVGVGDPGQPDGVQPEGGEKEMEDIEDGFGAGKQSTFPFRHN